MRLKASQLNWRASLARSYHVPTLNERFWIPQGNPNIRPEKGWVTESSLAWEPTLQTSVQYQIQLTAYHKKISDWIIWNPERNYRAENQQEAIATGIEAVAKVLTNKNEHSFILSGYHSLTRSTYQRLNSAFFWPGHYRQAAHLCAYPYGRRAGVLRSSTVSVNHADSLQRLGLYHFW